MSKLIAKVGLFVMLVGIIFPGSFLFSPKTVQAAIVVTNTFTQGYSDGKARVDIDVENTLDVTGGDDVTYDVSITVNGSNVFAQSNIKHFYLSRWRKVYATNGLVEAETYHDFAPYTQTGSVPVYDFSIMANPTYSFTNTYVGSRDGKTYEDFGILGKGGATSQYMWDPGGRPELALLPEWTAQYLGFKTQNLRKYTLLSGNQAGSWSIHIRESNGILVSLDQRPNFFLDSRAQGYGDPLEPKGNLNFTHNLWIRPIIT